MCLTYLFRCDTIIQVFEDAQKITVQENVCSCGAQLVNVEYRSDKSKLPNEATEKTGCIFCSDHFSKLVEKRRAAANSRPSRPFRGGKTAGRGRGRPTKRQPKDKMSQLAAYFV